MKFQQISRQITPKRKFSTLKFQTTEPWLVTTPPTTNNNTIPIYKNLINGSYQSSSSTPQAIAVINPATNIIQSYVPETSQNEFTSAVTSASNAFHSWKHVPIQQRQRIMLKYQALIRQYTDDIAELITIEQGKTMEDAKGDVFRGLEIVETSCSAITSMSMGDCLMGVSDGMDCISFREPLGVCAGIGTC